ncbi:MAG: hypothetical protein A2289_10260 [Deltaproteobacteria bacterium RIFOXYA12_FULL_58_15]|nr:MAG: hypothetical protein A2289_10260 [Deltaproteobacteria bacterium RIFOXYA12_FULL_58_15]OGR12573.1 MAG: hypothetical protein A2341_15130 [Deltaproteobacteria bacterium RIFOXYB12_FULL_58_9]
MWLAGASAIGCAVESPTGEDSSNLVAPPESQTNAIAAEHDCGCAKLDCQGGCENKECPDSPSPEEVREIESIPIEGSPVKGGENAKVTIVLSSEFECPYSARINSTIRKVMDEYGDDVALVYKHSPLPFHKNAIGAGLAAEAAHRQGKFWEMYEILFANQRQLSRENYLAWAEKLGLDVDAFGADLDSPELRRKIEQDQELVKSLGGRGVPNLWINGRHMVGAQPFEVIKRAIDEQLRE